MSLRKLIEQLNRHWRGLGAVMRTQCQLCSVCRFWADTGRIVACADGEQRRQGRCRAHPPRYRVPKWPETTSDDWCGEFEGKE